MANIRVECRLEAHHHLNQKRKRIQKITHEENITREVKMKHYYAKLEDAGLLSEYLEQQSPKPVRVIYKLDDPILSQKATRKASDIYLRELFAWNKLECDRMIHVLTKTLTYCYMSSNLAHMSALSMYPHSPYEMYVNNATRSDVPQYALRT